MKIELKKVNEPNGNFWYGIWINGDCQIPSFGIDLNAATKEFDKIVANANSQKPPYETILSTEIPTP
jgi:hypothetical protein